MLIVMDSKATEQDIEAVIGVAKAKGHTARLARDEMRALVAVTGNGHTPDPDDFCQLKGVERVTPTSHPFLLASRDSHPEATTIPVNGIRIGDKSVVIIAGPCAVEDRQQLLETAWAIKEAGLHILRGGAFKPRTSPYTFQGLGLEGLELLAEAREATGLAIATEVLAPEDVPLVAAYADILQVGARNMQNYALLRAVGKSRATVLLKRGMMSTVEELLMSAEYILSCGNSRVILCERGIRTFETYTRNTLDISAVPLLKELTHLPVIVDPSHATGRRDLVRPVSRAAVAAGTDGLLVEAHPRPEEALSDGAQSLKLEQLAQLVREVKIVAQVLGREVS